MSKTRYTEVDAQDDLYLAAVAERTFTNALEKTLGEITTYVPKPSSDKTTQENTVKDPIRMFYTALGESYMPTREEYDFVTKGGTSGGQKFVPRIALAIARNRATPKMDNYYRRIDELLKTYQIMRKNPWVLNRVLRVLERGFLKPTTEKLKKEYKTQEGLCAYVLPNHWEVLLNPSLVEKKKKIWEERTALIRGMVELDWAESTFPMFKDRVFVRDVILLTEDDVQFNATGSGAGSTIRFVKPKLWENVPSIKPHVDVLENVLSDRDIGSPNVHIYENATDSLKDVFSVLKENMPRWRIPTESGFLLESVLEAHRKDKELERNMKRRATPITQLRELVEEESTEDLGVLNSSADFSGSEEGPRAIEMFECLENPLTPTQIYKWGTAEAGSEKEFLELCHFVEKERQEIKDSLLEAEGDQFGHPEASNVHRGSHDEDPMTEEKEDLLVSGSEKDTEEELSLLSPALQQLSMESSRISSKTRRYLASPRNKAESSYHRNQNSVPLPMEYNVSYFLNRWPKSMSPSLDIWVSEVKKILLKCDGMLGLLEKKEFQLVTSLVEAVQLELSENLHIVSLAAKDGRTLVLTKACSKNIMKGGKGATANKISELSSRSLAFSRRRAFSPYLTDSVFRKSLPILDVKKVFTGGGTRKHSVVNHITERRSGFNTIRWAFENAFKNPRNTRLRAVSTLSKEMLTMSRSGKPSYAQQQRAKVYAEIWALMGRPDQADKEDDAKKSELKKGATKDSKKPSFNRS